MFGHGSLEYNVHFEVEEEMSKPENDGSYSCKDYDYDQECVYKKYEEIRKITSDNCTIPWALNNSKICTALKDVQTAYQRVEIIDQDERIDCPKKCVSMPILLTGGEVSSRPDEISLRLWFQPLIDQSVEKELYTFLSLLAEVGGYVGIFCGYSLLTLIDWLYHKIKIKFV